MGSVAVFVVGLAILVVGSELLLRGASRLGLSLGVRPFVLGLTVVSIGTSAPELAVGITAPLEGAPAIAVGNIAGTNLVNILFILGLSAAIRPIALHVRVLKLELPTIVAAAAVLTLLALDGTLTTLDGIVLLACGVAYTVVLVRASRHETRAVRAEFEEMYGADGARTGPMTSRLSLAVMLVAGILLALYGASLLVDGAVAIARALSMSEALIGLTIVAIGTSAPELMTTIIGTIRNERDVAVGNLIGSSIYNILVILGLTCVLLPGDLPVDEQLLSFDIPLMGAAAVLCVPVFITGRRVTRVEGVLFVMAYIAYLVWLIVLRG